MCLLYILLYILIIVRNHHAAEGSSVLNGTHFVKVGRVAQIVGNAHLHIHLNVTDLCSQQHLLLETIDNIQVNLTTTTSPRLQLKLNNTFDNLRNEVHRSDNVATMGRYWFNINANANKRNFAGLGMALSVGLSIYNLEEIMSLRERVGKIEKYDNTILMSLQQADLAIQRNTNSIRHLRNATVSLTEELSRMSEVIRITKITSALRHAVAMHNQFFYAVQRTFRALFVNSLDPEIIDLERLIQRYFEFGLMANRRGVSLAYEDIGSIFKSKISWIMESENLHIFVHLPLQNSNKLSIFKYLEIPLIWENLQAKIIPRNRKFLLAYDEEKHIGLDMSQDDLESCTKIKGEFFCENINLLKRNVSSTCTGALFLGQLNEVKAECEVIFVKDSAEHLVEINSTHVAIFAPEERKLHLSCEGQTLTVIKQLERGENILKIEEGCTLTTREFTFVPRMEVSSTPGIPVNIPRAARIEDFLSAHSPDQVKDVLRELELANVPNAASLDTIHYHLKRGQLEERTAVHRLSLTILTVTGLCLIVTVVVYIAVIRKKYKTKVKRTESSTREA